MKASILKTVLILLVSATHIPGILSESFSQSRLPAKSRISDEGIIPDKCGYDEEAAKLNHALLGDHWGYGYDDLLADLDLWNQSPYVTIDSLGPSVQNRALWQLTITSDMSELDHRRTIFIHARTHPSEVQGWWVTNELINHLLSDDESAQFLRERCVFYIIPMYNPDGVELEYGRENANGIDLESNWDKSPVEPEVAVLRNRFAELMASEAPIEVALNMHSAFACQRYFVYHDSVGTSEAFSLLEKDFIEGIRSYFLGGIQPWSYFISWTNGTLPYYPESWFWLNFGEAVMALTYEDMNCPTAGEFEKTALALLYGISDYLGLTPPTTVAEHSDNNPTDFILYQNFPNPVRSTNPTLVSTTFKYKLETAQNIRLALYDVLGRQISVLEEGYRTADIHSVPFNVSRLANGIYFYRLETMNRTITRQFTVVK